MNNLKVALLLATGSVLLLVSTIGVANADDRPTADTPGVPGVTVRDDGWIEYRSLLDEAGVIGERVRLEGERNSDGGCTISGSLSGEAGEGTQTSYSEEVAYNPATCEYELLVASLSDKQLATLDALAGATGGETGSVDDSGSNVSTADSESNVSTEERNATESPEPQAMAATTSTYARYLKTSFIDPFHIAISSQNVALKWNSSKWLRWGFKRHSFKGCIGPVCLDKTYMVSGSHSFIPVQNGWRKTAKIHFRNKSFALWVVGLFGAGGWAACGFPLNSTANFHHKNMVAGRRTGEWKVRWKYSKNGACTNLVRHRDRTGAAYPF